VTLEMKGLDRSWSDPYVQEHAGKAATEERDGD
jgi:hypothetical protein